MTDKPTPTTDLLKRCAEIYEWRGTGVLSGEALRDYAKRKWPDLHDTLQMAEHETVTEALALLAKWGQPAQAAQPDSVLEDAARYRWLFGARTAAQAACVSETVFKPLPQDEVLSHLQGFYVSKHEVDALIDAARKQGATQ